MLTGATVPSAGDAVLHGLSVRRDQAALRRVVGYCPQHDALEALRTGRETLRLYARIKQVPRARIEAAGGTIDHFGMPVDPGNLLLLAHMGERPVLGLPGCCRSPKLTS